MTEPSTPTKDFVPATSPYGSPEPLSELSVVQPTGPTTPFATSPLKFDPPKFAVEIITSRPADNSNNVIQNDNNNSQSNGIESSYDPAETEYANEDLAPVLASSPPEIDSVKQSITDQEVTGFSQDQVTANRSISNPSGAQIGSPSLDPADSVEESTSSAQLASINEVAESSVQVTEPALSSSPPASMQDDSSSTTATPNAQVIKRRRLNPSTSANKRLSKPFKSPLKLMSSNDASTSRSSSIKYPPSTPPKSNVLPYTPLPQAPIPKLVDDDLASPNISMSPPSLPHKSSRVSTGSSNPPFRSSFKNTPKPKISSVSHKSPQIISLEQKLAKLQNSLRDAKQELEEASQALKIEKSGEDSKLEELIVKWRGAAQAAADDMFSGVEQRVARMGGVAAYNQMQKQRSSGGGWGFTDEDPEEGLTDSQKEMRKQAMYEAGLEDVSALEKEETGVKDELEQGDHFTMDMMLKSLNIDLDIMGYDKTLQRWTK